ncbi:TlpA disulfide reductase family protein [Allomuricauda sp. d1]|uniref:TlpA disulfide reductase family protein n=1 Tax=Allomuricauda sp. d1 TaxID=3136725 RepID=UPI0031E096DE
MTKKLTALFFIGMLITACSTKSESFVLKGDFEGELENGTNVYLRTSDSLNQIVDVDTAQTLDGTFQFEGNQEIPHLHYVFVDGTRGNIPVILENGTIELTFHKDSLEMATLEGTVQNELFMGFLEESRKHRDMVLDMQDDIRKASAERDTVAMSSLRDEYFELQQKARDLNVDFVNENPNALISALILENLMQTKAIPNKKIDSLYQTLTPEIKKTQPAKNIQTQLNRSVATNIGQKAPDFSGPTPMGDKIALNDVEGKLVLVDFWAAWCRPCRAENPNIVSVYEKYKDKGFNVLGVSLDRKKEDWEKAIINDSLSWSHISNLKYFQDPIAQLYNINSIPASFLLDENGVIVAKNLRGPALEAKVAELIQ